MSWSRTPTSRSGERRRPRASLMRRGERRGCLATSRTAGASGPSPSKKPSSCLSRLRRRRMHGSCAGRPSSQSCARTFFWPAQTSRLTFLNGITLQASPRIAPRILRPWVSFGQGSRSTGSMGRTFFAWARGEEVRRNPRGSRAQSQTPRLVGLGHGAAGAFDESGAIRTGSYHKWLAEQQKIDGKHF